MKKAMILAAGLGTRMMPLTANTPKPLLPVGGEPLLRHILNYIHSYGYDEIIINVSYLKNKIKEYVKTINLPIRITLIEENEVSGSAGAIKKAQSLIDDNFLVINGDVLTNIDINKLETFHKNNKAIATLSLVRQEDVSKFGVVITDKNNKIKQFQEKPEIGKELSHYINAGVYMFSPEIFDFINIEKSITDLAYDIFPKLLGKKFYGLKNAEVMWKDIGSIKDYEEVNASFSRVS